MKLEKPSWISRQLIKFASGIEAFRKPEARGESFTFSNFNQFSDWLTDTSNDSDEKVTATSSSKLATLWGCVNVLAQDVASLEFQVRKEVEDGREILKNNLYQLINKKPNRLENAWQFWYGMIYVGEIFGNSYAYILRNSKQEPQELIRLKPWLMQIEIVDGQLWYVYNNEAIPARDIFHYRTFPNVDGGGVSKPLHLANLMGLKQKQNKFAAKSTGNKPPGYLTGENLKLEQLTQIQESWNRHISGDNVGGTPVLAGNVDYKQLMLSSEAAEIVQMTEWTDRQTYSAYRMQPVMVSNHKDSNYSNAEQQNIIHAKYTLTPILTCIEQEADEKLVSERQKNVVDTKLNIKGLLRGDMASFAQYVSTMTTLGHLNSDEIREMDDLPPQKDSTGKTGIGKIYMAQGAMASKENLIKGQEDTDPTGQRMLNEIQQVLSKHKMNGQNVSEQ